MIPFTHSRQRAAADGLMNSFSGFCEKSMNSFAKTIDIDVPADDDFA
jgi:hypothetical protein